MPTAQVHRFRDRVAAYLSKGPTTYLSPTEARQFGQALIAAADDCEAVESFAASKFRTVEVTLAEPQP